MVVPLRIGSVALGVKLPKTPSTLLGRIRKAMAERRLSRLDEIYLADSGAIHILRQGKWLRGRSERNIGAGQAALRAGLLNARIFGRQNEQVGALSLDDPDKHEIKMRVHPDDAEVLQRLGFRMPRDNIVGWTSIAQSRQSPGGDSEDPLGH
jgi:hypothetical protein